MENLASKDTWGCSDHHFELFILQAVELESLVVGPSLYEIDLPGHKLGRGSWVLFMLFEHDYTAYQ